MTPPQLNNALIPQGDGAPVYRTYRPHPALMPYVDYLFEFLIPENIDWPLEQILVPNDHPVLLFHLGVRPLVLDNKGNPVTQPRVLLVGLSTIYHNMSLEPGTVIMGVYFRSNGYHALFGQPMADFTNLGLPANDVIGNDMLELWEQISEAPLPRDRLALIQDYLLARVIAPTAPPLWFNDLIQHMRAHRGRISIQDLSKRYEVSRQHLHRIFLEQVGLQPKAYNRLLRLHNVLAHLRIQPEMDLQELLFSAGFYDQSHFIREFHYFIGMTPAAFLGLDKRLADLYAGL